MSSDESGFDDDNNEILINHKLPWLSDKVQNFMMLLDQETTKSKSPQAKRQMKKRIDGLPSSRPMPANEGIQPICSNQHQQKPTCIGQFVYFYYY